MDLSQNRVAPKPVANDPVDSVAQRGIQGPWGFQGTLECKVFQAAEGNE